MRADNGKVGHVDTLLSILLNEGHAAETSNVARPLLLHLGKVTCVDLIDDHQVTRKKLLNEVHGPTLKSLGKNGVVGVSHGLGSDFPSLLPVELLLVDEKTHKLRDGKCRVSVVQLDSDLLREVLEVGTGDVAVAEGGRLVTTDNILERGRGQEILLLETKLLALEEVVVGVEHTGDVLGQVAVNDSSDVVTMVEVGEIEAVGASRRPQTHGVAYGVLAVARDGRVVGHSHHDLAVRPGEAEATSVDDVAIEQHRGGILRTSDFPRVAVAEPVVGDLDLLAVTNLLLENTILITETVAISGQGKGRHGVKEARSKTAKTTVAETSVLLNAFKSLNIKTKLVHGLLALIAHTEVNHGVGESTTHVVFKRQVVNTLGILLVVGLLGTDPLANKTVTNSVCKGHEVVMLGGHISILDEGVMKVTVKHLFHLLHAFHSRNATERNLLLAKSWSFITTVVRLEVSAIVDLHRLAEVLGSEIRREAASKAHRCLLIHSGRDLGLLGTFGHFRHYYT
eukprot:Colp12_sorted_trinity150504_noHs@1565